MGSKAVVILGCATLLACAPTIQNAAKQATRAAVDESVEQLTSEEAKSQFKEAAQDPKVEAATKEMTDQLAEGLLASLSADKSREQIAALARTFTAAAVEQLVASLSSGRNRARLEELTKGVTTAALAQAALSLESELGPAMGTALQNDLVPAMSTALDAELQAKLGSSAQLVAHRAVLGASRGIDDAFLSDGAMLQDVRAVSANLPQWLWLIAATLSAFALLVVCAAIIAISRTRRARLEVQRLESATLLLATAMREKQASEQTDEIVAIVQSALARPAGIGPGQRLLSALGLRKPHTS